MTTVYQATNEFRDGTNHCMKCDFTDKSAEIVNMHFISKHMSLEKAKRFPVDFRFDLLDPEFILTLSKIANQGVQKYGEYNYQKSRLIGKDSPVNHIYHHLHKYQTNQPYDHEDVGVHRKEHLAAIAFNAMMEFWYECHPEVKC